jgi:hypothetical protein
MGGLVGGRHPVDAVFAVVWNPVASFGTRSGDRVGSPLDRVTYRGISGADRVATGG